VACFGERSFYALCPDRAAQRRTLAQRVPGGTRDVTESRPQLRARRGAGTAHPHVRAADVSTSLLDEGMTAAMRSCVAFANGMHPDPNADRPESFNVMETAR
jgi:hypothetical protein